MAVLAAGEGRGFCSCPSLICTAALSGTRVVKNVSTIPHSNALRPQATCFYNHAPCLIGFFTGSCCLRDRPASPAGRRLSPSAPPRVSAVTIQSGSSSRRSIATEGPLISFVPRPAAPEPSRAPRATPHAVWRRASHAVALAKTGSGRRFIHKPGPANPSASPSRCANRSRLFLVVGQTPTAFPPRPPDSRRLSSPFEGERLVREAVSGNDWQLCSRRLLHQIGRCVLVLRTTDRALDRDDLSMPASGSALAVVEKLDRGEEADPATYYFRMSPMLKTSATKYDWMNSIIAIGTGYQRADGPIRGIF